MAEVMMVRVWHHMGWRPLQLCVLGPDGCKSRMAIIGVRVLIYFEPSQAP